MVFPKKLENLIQVQIFMRSRNFASNFFKNFNPKFSISVILYSYRENSKHQYKKNFINVMHCVDSSIAMETNNNNFRDNNCFHYYHMRIITEDKGMKSNQWDSSENTLQNILQHRIWPLYDEYYMIETRETMIDDVNKNKKLYSLYVTLYTRLIISDNYRQQVGTVLLYIRGGVDLGLGYLYKHFYELYLQNNLQIFIILTNFCQNLNFKITYEELCIKFSSILIGPKKFYRYFKKKFSEKLKISVLKKTQNILKIKSCKENANLNNWINRYRFTISKTYGKLSVVVSILSYQRKKFYDFSTSKLLANFRVFDRFPTIRTTHKEPSKVIQHFFTDTSKKNSHKNRKFQWSINNSKKFLNYNHIKKSIRSKTGFA
ncbi:hypothetical protein AGLY_011550 [Aphis glycines]|uniref:Uncharacterized protein n=1 Tax=Aphis glycines TaxID=307491 RepID=A0A6G0TBU2_APHGL|nr:hypothetical protein AGLY_011550 [Aphis glycines]